ncbi:bifunctional indole-3-glycerol phosphate synthase/phosphoribosylanthranilate isomerase [Helicobacter sp. MIT 03-1616]|nr:bifunctional indole-3-glycerol phosphate synthase/phosphoribosylanthranilate isomerase [Helicobacter sp. MIT 03-1616]
MIEILHKITQERAQDITQKGFALGHNVPQSRIHPLIKPKLDSTFFIAEIKRASPSHGDLSKIDEPIKLAQDYLNGGAGAISVLCEERHFKGSLADLMAVKSAYPNACILRKDFIQYPQEIEISYCAGADMVLLIAAMFINEDKGFIHLQAIYEECLKYGITPLLEVHTQKEIDFIAPLNPTLVGINARNLHTLEIDIIQACALKSAITSTLPHTQVMFESGINSPHSAFIVGSFGFSGILCGSYLVAHNNPTRALQSLKNAFLIGKNQQPRFYRYTFPTLTRHNIESTKIESAQVGDSQILLKVCGITNLDNALLIAEEATKYQHKITFMLGFILAQNSPRFIESKRIKEISKALHSLYPHILRVVVVKDDKNALNEAKTLYEQGHIDAIQLHGLDSLTPHTFAHIPLKEATFCFYGVQNIAKAEDFIADYEGAFCLVDSQSAQGGGSGKRIDTNVLCHLKERYLCIAGGISADNINEFLSLSPTMLDISSGVESVPGVKDIDKIKMILHTIESYQAKKASSH